MTRQGGTKVQARHFMQRILTLPEGPRETNKALMIHLSGGFFCKITFHTQLRRTEITLTLMVVIASVNRLPFGGA